MENLLAGAAAGLILLGCADGSVSETERTRSSSLPLQVVDTLVPTDGAEQSSFAYDVAISGDVIVVGAPDDPYGTYSGAVYVFERNAEGRWLGVQKLTGDGMRSDRFGSSVAILDGTLLVGATGGGDTHFGAVFVYEKGPDGNWMQRQRLTVAGSGQAFGERVAISGDRALVATEYETFVENYQLGTVHVFERDAGGSWQWRQRFMINDPPSVWAFGASVGISGNFAIMGADLHGGPGNPALALIYERTAEGNWLERQLLEFSSGDSREFNTEVAIAGTAAFVGSPYEVKAGVFEGIVYVLSQDPSGEFIETQQLTSPEGETARHFGTSVAISGNTAVVGSTNHAAYVYTRDNDGKWSFLEQLSDPMPGNSYYGFRNAIDATTIVVGHWLGDAAVVFDEGGYGGSGSGSGGSASGQGGATSQGGGTNQAGAAGGTEAAGQGGTVGQAGSMESTSGSSGAPGSTATSGGSRRDSDGCTIGAVGGSQSSRLSLFVLAALVSWFGRRRSAYTGARACSRKPRSSSFSMQSSNTQATRRRRKSFR